MTWMTGSPLDYFLICFTAMVTTLLLVPSIKRLARVTGAIDEPNERKIHTGHVPRMGGLAMFLGCLLTFLIYLEGFEQYRGFFLGMVIIVIVGMVDDSIGLEPKIKLLGQIIAACAAISFSDININFLGDMTGTPFSLGLLSGPITVFWIVGITNAINLSDGLDGLAGGISLIAFTCFGFLAYQRADYATFMLCLVLTGSILGFLRYNSHPAEIFMGDTGSLFLGFCLGTFSIAGHFKSLTTITLITPVLVLLVPIADTLWAIIRRVREGRSPFSADKLHFHHKLLSKGMNQPQTVSVIYAISAGLSLSAVALGNTNNFKFLFVPFLLIGLLLFFLQVFGILDLGKWTNRILHPFDSRFSFQTQPLFSKFSLRCIQAGTIIYVTSFILGLPLVPINLLLVVGTTFVLILYLSATKGQNGHNFMIFSYFFLAAVIVMVVNYLQSGHPRGTYTLLDILEPLGFFVITLGIVGKIIVRKTKDIFLSTPLEFFIFLVLVSIAMFPAEIRSDYNLVHNTLRTFFLFLAFKIIALNWQGNQSTSLSVQAG